MNRFSLAARFFIWMTILSGSGMVVWLNREPQLPADWGALIVLLSLFLVSVLSDFFRISLGYNIYVTLATASNFAVLLIFGLPFGAAIGAVSGMVSDIIWKKAWYKILFNAANTAISITCADTVYRLAGDGGPSPLSSGQNALATGAAGATYLLINCALVCLAVGLTSGVSPLNVASSNLKGVGLQCLTLIPVGTLIVVVYDANPWALLLVLFPIALVHYSFHTYQELRSQAMRTIELLATTIDKRDPYTYRHSQRVAEFVEKIARRMGLGLYETEAIVFAARIHDLGKISIDSSILLKPSSLTPEEQKKVEEHPTIGAEIISQLSFYGEVKEMVIYHQEKYDGRGYPAGLKGNEIPFGARIIAVADAFEAMTSDRPYRRAMSMAMAVGELRKHRGTQFDPAVVDAFILVLEGEKLVLGEQFAMTPADAGAG